jgi:hypothetical protein
MEVAMEMWKVTLAPQIDNTVALAVQTGLQD